MTNREPWSGTPGVTEPDQLVTVTLPASVAKRVLDAIVYSGHRIVKRRPDDVTGLKAMSLASARFGDVLHAPYHRRFNYEDKERAKWAVLAGNAMEYSHWITTVYNRLGDSDKVCYYPGGPVFIDSLKDVEKHDVFNGATNCGTAYRREDFQELYAAVKWRTL